VRRLLATAVDQLTSPGYVLLIELLIDRTCHFAQRKRMSLGQVDASRGGGRTARRNGTSSSYTSRLRLSLSLSRSIIRLVHDAGAAQSRRGRAQRTVRHAPRRGYYKFSGSKRRLGSHVEKRRRERERERGNERTYSDNSLEQVPPRKGRGQACLSHIKDTRVLSAPGRAACALLRGAGMRIRDPPCA